jgi:hypothetical protein
MPTILRIEGYRFFFFSNEGHERPHVHIESGEKYAKYWLKPVVLSKSFGYHPAELSYLRKLVEVNQKLFLEKWHEYFA